MCTRAEYQVVSLLGLEMEIIIPSYSLGLVKIFGGQF